MHPTDDLLNGYVDDGLTPAEREQMEEHLRACEECRLAVDDYRELARAGAALEPLEPPPHAWNQLRAALRDEPGARFTRHRRADRGRSARGWRLATAGAVAALLVIATVVGVRGGWIRKAHPEQSTAVIATAGPAPSVAAVQAELQQAETHYRTAIAELEQITASGEQTLDPITARTLQSNLAVIDRAMSESRAALAGQPGSEAAEASLLDGFKAKLALLEDTVALINEMRKGNDTGAARIVSSLQKRT